LFYVYISLNVFINNNNLKKQYSTPPPKKVAVLSHIIKHPGPLFSSPARLPRGEYPGENALLTVALLDATWDFLLVRWSSITQKV